MKTTNVNLLLLTFCLLFLPIMLQAQDATFYADTTNSMWKNFVSENKRTRDHVMGMEWRVKGQVLRFGSGPIRIKADPNTIDTLFYKFYEHAKWDTIICNVKKPGVYKFIYNICCGGFDVTDENGEHIKAKVNFRISGDPNGKTYLGSIGALSAKGILVTKKTSETISPDCQSAMNPNISWIGFQEIEICSDTSICKESYCSSETNEEGLLKSVDYRTISKKLEILFMPLGEPLQIIYDTRRNKFLIK